MRASTDLHRALARTTVGMHRRMAQRHQGTQEYLNQEREQQFQHNFSGHLGDDAPETTFKQLFDIIFACDAGVARYSQLDEPIVRFGFRMVTAPKGSVPYAYVSDWIYDDDLNYIGVHVTVGIHNTLGAFGPYQGVLHSTFQGFGTHLEDDAAAIGDLPA